MKKLLIIILITMSFGVDSQVNPHAIGVRFRGDGRANGAEVSYQHGFGEKNRLELDFGGRRHPHWHHFGIAGIYHWVWNLDDALNWYIGPGAMIGVYRSKNNIYDEGLTLGIGGQIGLEYDFNQHDVPILLSLDWRPMFDLYEYYEYYYFGYGGGFSVRYTFE